MKYKSLRLLSSLFAIALLFSMIPMAHASSTRASDYFAYTDLWAPHWVVAELLSNLILMPLILCKNSELKKFIFGNNNLMVLMRM